MTTMSLVEHTLKSITLTAVSDITEDLDVLQPNHVLFEQPVVTKPLMPDSITYVARRKTYTAAQAYNQMI